MSHLLIILLLQFFALVVLHGIALSLIRDLLFLHQLFVQLVAISFDMRHFRHLRRRESFVLAGFLRVIMVLYSAHVTWSVHSTWSVQVTRTMLVFLLKLSNEVVDKLVLHFVIVYLTPSILKTEMLIP